MRRILAPTVLLALTLFVVSCSEDAGDAVLTGRWQGTEATAEFQPTGSPVSVYNETIPDFNPVIEFREDGSVSVEEEGTTTSGTWTFADGNKKIVANVDFQNEYFGASETFTIDQLTSNKLILLFERDGDFDIPDFGSVSGRLSVTLNFDRVD